MRKQDLIQAIGLEWGKYLSFLKAGLAATGYDVNKGWGIARAEAAIGEPCKAAYAKFQKEQKRLNAQYGTFQNAPWLRQEAHRERDLSVHNAQARIDRYLGRVNQEQLHINKILNGDFAKYGVTEPDNSEIASLESAKVWLNDAVEELVTVTEQAEAKLKAVLAGLDRIRPEKEEKVNAVRVTPREEQIRSAVAGFGGRRTANGRPWLRDLNRLYGFNPRVSRKERDKAYSEVTRG